MTDILDAAHHPKLKKKKKKIPFLVLLSFKGERIKYGNLLHGAP
jgi:hypothetical protein